MNLKPTLESCLEDVETRFLYNLPESELSQTDRLFFQIEQAWWFYEDFYADAHPNLQHFKSLKAFADKIFAHCPLLSKSQHRCNELFTEFGAYKNQIPVAGCILLNTDMTKIALVCSWGGKCWGFPRGKINEGETTFDCAIRETFEETGFDASAHTKADDELFIFEDSKPVKLFISTSVPESTIFVPQTRKEVSAVAFHFIDSLPKTYGVLPFISKLRRWISKRGRGRGGSTGNDVSRKSTTAVSASTAKPSPTKKEKARAASVESAMKKKGERKRDPASSREKMRTSASFLFDDRNLDTFGVDTKSPGRGSKVEQWGVDDMFKANSKLTGRSYEYDGNPHSFGSSHPRFVDYRNGGSTVPSSPVVVVAASRADLSAGPDASRHDRNINEARRKALLGALKSSTQSAFPPQLFQFKIDIVDAISAVDRVLASHNLT